MKVVQNNLFATSRYPKIANLITAIFFLNRVFASKTYTKQLLQKISNLELKHKISLNSRMNNGITFFHKYHTHTLLSSDSNDCKHFCTTWLPLGSLMSSKNPGRRASTTRLISSLVLRLSISFCTARVLQHHHQIHHEPQINKIQQ